MPIKGNGLSWAKANTVFYKFSSSREWFKVVDPCEELALNHHGTNGNEAYGIAQAIRQRFSHAEAEYSCPWYVRR